MRLIDADALDWWYKGRNIRRVIDDAPTVDAVVVTRCKDCIRCGFCGEATNLEVMGFYGFCSRGERKDGDSDATD